MKLQSQTKSQTKRPANATADSPTVPSDRPDLQALLSLRKIMRAADERSHALASQHGITVPQLLCLRKIVEMGEISIKELSTELYLKPGVASGIVDLLETRQFIIRRRFPADRHGAVLVATDSGRELVERVPPQLHESLLEAFGEMPSEKQQRLADALEEVVDLLGVDESGFSPILEIRPQLDRPVSPLASRRYMPGPVARAGAAGAPVG